LTFPDLSSAGELLKSNLIMPEPCPFFSDISNPCSVVRPTSTEVFGAVVAFNGLNASGLFNGQSQAFFDFMNGLAANADAAKRLGYNPLPSPLQVRGSGSRAPRSRLPTAPRRRFPLASPKMSRSGFVQARNPAIALLERSRSELPFLAPWLRANDLPKPIKRAAQTSHNAAPCEPPWA